jgi:hypothetical protein
MKNLFTWLKQKLAPGDHDDDPYRGRPAVSLPARPRPNKPSVTAKRARNPQAPEDFEYSSESTGRIADGGPGKNVLIQNRYVREDTGTHETLKILDDSIVNSDESAEFDPYNTGRFDRSKTWDAPTRKK